MNTLHFFALSAAAVALSACGREQTGIFAERSIPIIAPPASADTPPRFVGAWAASADQCADPWVLEPRRLSRGQVACDFAKVDPSSAGYAIASVCRAGSGARPGRLMITAPDAEQMTSLTVSGGPFRDPVALQRCAAR